MRLKAQPEVLMPVFMEPEGLGEPGGPSFAEETRLVRVYTSTLGIERSLEGWTDSSSC